MALSLEESTHSGDRKLRLRSEDLGMILQVKWLVDDHPKVLQVVSHI